jgi:hypothetical protein
MVVYMGTKQARRRHAVFLFETAINNGELSFDFALAGERQSPFHDPAVQLMENHQQKYAFLSLAPSVSVQINY